MDGGLQEADSKVRKTGRDIPGINPHCLHRDTVESIEIGSLNAQTHTIYPHQTGMFPSQEARLRGIVIGLLTPHLFRAGLRPPA